MNITTRVALVMVAVGMAVTLATTAATLARDWVQARERAAYEAGWQARERAPVCHTTGGQEDGALVGCDYRAGAWWIDR